MHRLIVFCGNSPWIPGILLGAAIGAAAKRRNIHIVAVCRLQPADGNHPKLDYLGAAAIRLNRALHGRYPLRNAVPPFPVDIDRLAAKYGIPVIVPPANRVNDPQFIEMLKSRFSPTAALSFYFMKRLGPELLLTLQQAVNYHNGSLPDYAGIFATNWSIYNREQRSGYCFHRMEGDLDTGPLLSSGSVAVGNRPDPLALELEKAHQAAQALPGVLDMIADDASAEAQASGGHYYSWQQHELMRTIASPAMLSRDELLRRHHAFGALEMKFADRWFTIRRISAPDHDRTRAGRFYFRSADGIRMEAGEFEAIPYLVFRVKRKLAARLSVREQD